MKKYIKSSVTIDEISFSDVESFLHMVCPMIRDYLDDADVDVASSEVDDIGRDMWFDLSDDAEFSDEEFDDYLGEYMSDYVDSYFDDYEESAQGFSYASLGDDVTMTLTYNGKLLGSWEQIEDVESPELLAMMETDSSVVTSVINYLKSIDDDEINAHIDSYMADGNIRPVYDDFTDDLALQLDCCQQDIIDNYNVDFDGFSIRTIKED